MTTDIAHDILQRKLEEWGKQYPLAANVMLGNMSHDELVEYVEENYCVDCANKGYTDEDGQWFEKKPEYPDRDETPYADDLN